MYFVQIFTVFNPSRTSSLVTAIFVIPDIKQECFTTTRSSHPHRLGLLVVVPYSCPFCCRCSPVLSRSSVGNGPLPTLVVYAFTTPIISSTFL